MMVLPGPAITLAEDQDGVIARFQLMRWLEPRQVDFLVEAGFLVRIQRGVYRVAGGANLAIQVPFAAALRARPAATITGPAVLRRLGVDGYRDAEVFEVLVARQRTLRNVDFAWREDPDPTRGVQRCKMSASPVRSTR
jgi:hypothetical protein